MNFLYIFTQKSMLCGINQFDLFFPKMANSCEKWVILGDLVKLSNLS